MGTIIDLAASLNLNIQNFSKQLSSAASQLNSFASKSTGGLGSIQAETEKTGNGFKDVTRIVQGILVSKAFYAVWQDLNAATGAVWNFSNSLEYADIAYTALFNDADLSDSFLSTLKQYAADTVFEFQDLESSARRLLAYGMDYSNIMYVMKGVLATSTLSNDEFTVERISRAIGQIYTKGRLMNEEMRQLAESGVPAYAILTEKLGLTQKQLQNLGDMSIPAADAINALIEGMTERYGATVDAAATTTTGIINKISDNALQLGAGLFSPLIDSLKGYLGSMGSMLSDLREAYDIGGAGAVFEKLIPDEATQEKIRLFFANLMVLWDNIKLLFSTLGPILGAAFGALIGALNVLLPIINAVSGVVLSLTGIFTTNAELMMILSGVLAAAATMFVLFKIKALAAMAVAAVSKVIIGLGKAFQFLSIAMSANPVFLILTLVAALVAFGVAASSASGGISSLMQSLVEAEGVDTEGILLPETKDNTADLEKFNKQLKSLNSNLDDTADSAKKAAKQLLSFDEVYKLANPDEITAPKTDKQKMEERIGKMETEPPEETMEKSKATGTISPGGKGNVLDNFWEGVYGWLLETFEKTKIGLWDETIKPFWDEVIWNPIKGLFSWGKQAGKDIWSWTKQAGIDIGDWCSQAGKDISSWCSTAIDDVGNWFSKAGSDVKTWCTNAAIDVGVWAVTAGTDIKNWCNTAVADIGNWFSTAGTDIKNWCNTAIADIGNWFSKAGSDVTNWCNTAIADIGNWFSEAGSDISSWCTTAISDIDNWFSEAGSDITNWCNTAIADVGNWFNEAGSDITNWCNTAVSDIDNWFSEAGSDITNWCNTAIADVSNWFNEAGSDITNWCNTAIADVGNWFSKTGTNITDWCNTAIADVGNWFNEAGSDITNWCNTAISDIDNWFSEAGSDITNWCNTAIADVGNWFNEAGSDITSWCDTAISDIDNWFSEAGSDITNWCNTAISDVSNWFSKTGDNIGDWCTTAISDVGDWFSNTGTKISDWCTNAKDDIGNWFTETGSKISEWCTTAIEDVKEWGKNFGDKWNDFWGITDEGGESSSFGGGEGGRGGHAVGGIFNKEHVARFAEGNKAEAVIPLENYAAMRPFITAIGDTLLQGILPSLMSSRGTEAQLQPVYVGTLIADERGLRELEKKLRIVRVQETSRRGLD